MKTSCHAWHWEGPGVCPILTVYNTWTVSHSKLEVRGRTNYKDLHEYSISPTQNAFPLYCCPQKTYACVLLYAIHLCLCSAAYHTPIFMYCCMQYTCVLLHVIHLYFCIAGCGDFCIAARNTPMSMYANTFICLSSCARAEAVWYVKYTTFQLVNQPGKNSRFAFRRLLGLRYLALPVFCGWLTDFLLVFRWRKSVSNSATPQSTCATCLKHWLPPMLLTDP